MIKQYFNSIVIIWIILAIILFPLLVRVKAPYGRHTKSGWGPLIGNQAGWILMELPSLLLFTILFLSGDLAEAGIKWLFFGLWAIHYTNRIFIFPLRTKTKGKKMPLLILIMAMVFNLVNAFVNGYWLGQLAGSYYNDWLKDPRFIAGILLFAAGFIINQIADNHLIGLRKTGNKEYSIPSHRLFSKISCPNFAGEIVEWTGFALMTWSLPGLSFALWSMANLIPRAMHHHAWYKNRFPDYPGNRKAVIPWIL